MYLYRYESVEIGVKKLENLCKHNTKVHLTCQEIVINENC